MKRFKFRLESALSLRSFRRSEASRALANARNKRTEIANKLQASEEKYSEASNELVLGRGKRVTADLFVRRQAAVSYYREEIKRIGEQYRDVLELENRCYRELMAARQEEQALMRLKEKAKEAYQMELIRSDEQAVQEFVNAQRRKALV